ncbi:MAG: glycosyltransferase family 4 protein, partial [Myxococcales bacterium]|nr:glycosyltransferase family 4 protein [Myxococcales bacterium]
MPLGVGMLAGVFPPLIGGIQTHTLLLSRTLAGRGVEVHVLTRHYRGLRRHEWISGVEVHRVGEAGVPRGLRAASYLAGALAAMRRLRDRIQVLHAHQLYAPAAVGVAGRAMLGRPLILNPHSPVEIASLGPLRRRCGDAFVSICAPIADGLRRAGVPRERIHSIPNGVDTAHFRPASLEERAELRRTLGLPPRPTIVYAGRLARVKGIDVLLDAWPRFEGKAQLCLVGGGEDEGVLRAQAAKLRGVHFVGPVRDAAPWLRAADAGVLPSRSEGLSVALLEAMSCGLPMVATAVGGSAGAIDDGIDGLLVPPEDPAALAIALGRALETPSLGAA